MAAGDLKIGLGIDIDLEAGTIDTTSLKKILATVLKELRIPTQGIKANLNVTPDIKFDRKAIRNSVKGFEADIRAALKEIDDPREDLPPGIESPRDLLANENQKKIYDLASKKGVHRGRVDRLLNQVAPLGDILDDPSFKDYSLPEKPRADVLKRGQDATAAGKKTTEPQRRALLAQKEYESAVERLRPLNEAFDIVQKTPPGQVAKLSSEQSAALKDFEANRALIGGQFDKVTNALSKAGLGSDLGAVNVGSQSVASDIIKRSNKELDDSQNVTKQEAIAKRQQAVSDKAEAKRLQQQKVSTAAVQKFEGQRDSAREKADKEAADRAKSSESSVLREQKNRAGQESFSRKYLKDYNETHAGALEENAKFDNAAYKKREAERRRTREQLARDTGKAEIDKARADPARVGKHSTAIDVEDAKRMNEYLDSRRERLAGVRDRIPEGSRRQGTRDSIKEQIDTNQDLQNALKAQQQFYKKTPEKREDQIRSDTTASKREETTRERARNAQDKIDSTNQRLTQGRRLLEGAERDSDFSSRGRFPDSEEAKKTIEAANREKKDADALREKLRTKDAETGSDSSDELVALNKRIKDLDASIAKLTDTFRARTKEGSEADQKAIEKKLLDEGRVLRDRDLIDRGRTDPAGPFASFDKTESDDAKKAIVRQQALNTKAQEGIYKATKSTDPEVAKAAASKLELLRKEAKDLSVSFSALDQHIKGVSSGLQEAKKLEAKAARENTPQAQAARAQAERDLVTGNRFVDEGIDHGFKNVQNTQEGRLALGAVKARQADDQAKLQELNQLQGKGVKGLEGDYARLNNRIHENDKAMQGLQRRMTGFGAAASQTTLLLRQFFRYAVGYHVLYAAAGAVAAFGQSLVDLDTELTSITAITGANAGELGEIESAIKRIATTTRFTNTEIAKSARVLAQSGVDPAKIRETLAATAQFAAATGGTIEVSADLISTMRKVFDELEAVDISDKLATAINISKLTAEDLKPILSISANIAKSYNLTADQYLAAVTTLRNAGLKASTVATGLRQGLVELFAPKTKTLKALQLRYREIGEVVSKEDIATRFKGFKESPEPLKEVLQELDRLGFSDEGDRTIGSRSFNIRAENAIKALVSNADALASAQAKLSISGSSLLGSQIQLESLSATVDNLGATITVFGDSLTDGAIPTLQDFVAHSVEALRTLTELNDELKADSGAGYGTILKAASAVGIATFGLTRGGILEKGRNAAVGAVATTALGPYGVRKIDDFGLDPSRVSDSVLSAAFMAPMIATVIRYMGAKVPVGYSNVKAGIASAKDRYSRLGAALSGANAVTPVQPGRYRRVLSFPGSPRKYDLAPAPSHAKSIAHFKAQNSGIGANAGTAVGYAAQIGIFFHLITDSLKKLFTALTTGSVISKIISAANFVVSKAGLFGVAIAGLLSTIVYVYRNADEAKRQRQKYQQKVRNLQDNLSQTNELEQEAEGLQFSDVDGSPAKSGSSAELLETLDRELERLDDRTERILEANVDDIGDYLRRLDQEATAGSASRAAVLRELADFALSGDVKEAVLSLTTAQGRLSEDQVILTRDLTDLARSFVDSREAVEGFREKLFAQYEQMLELGDAATEGQKALVAAIDARVFTSEFDILSGDIDGGTEETRGLMEAILRDTHEAIQKKVKEQQLSDKARLEEVIEEFNDVILAVDNPADIHQLIIDLGLSTKRVGGSMEDLLQGLLENLDQAEAAILAGRGRLVFDPDTGEIARDANGNEQRTYGPTKQKDLQTIKTTRRLVNAKLESTRNTENRRITQAEETAEGVARNIVPKYYELKKKVRDDLGADFELQIVELKAGIDKADAALKAGTRKGQYIFTDGDGNNTKPVADVIREFDSESLKQAIKVDAQFEAVQPDIKNRVDNANREADANDRIAALDREAVETSRETYRAEFETFKRQQDAKKTRLDADIAKANANIARASADINDAERVKQLPKFNEQLTKAIRKREEYERQALFDRKEAELEMNEALRILSQATREGVIDRTPTGPVPLYAPDPAFDDTATSLGRVGSRGLAYQRKGEDLDRLDRFGIDTRDTRLRTSAADADVLRDTIGLRREELVDFDAGKIEKDLKGEDRTAARQQRLKELESLNEQLGTVNSQIDQLGNTAWDEIQEGLDFETLAQSFESVGVALEGMGEAINGIVVDGFSELGSTFNDSIRSGESFRDAVRNITADVADAIADMVANMIVQEAIAYGLRIIGGLFGGAGGGGSSTVAANAGGSAAKSVPVAGLYTGISDVALLRTGIADVAALSSSPLLMASGGMIHGPGTGTSDSIPGVILDSDGKIRKGIRVSDGEAILNAKATTALGKTTIDAINTGQITKMATGGIVGSSYETVANSSPAMQNSAGSSGGTALDFDDSAPEDKFTIMNVVDKELFDDYLATPAGGRTLVNRIRKNSAAIKQVLR